MANSPIYSRLLAPLMIGALCLLGSGCDTETRLSRLEKQIQELQAEVKKVRAVTDYDLQAKCAKDAKAWFRENWQADKNTMLLDYRNHYSKSLNKCFALVEQHSSASGHSWINQMSVWDVYENSLYGSFDQVHMHYGGPGPDVKSEDLPADCTVFGKTCKTIEEFNGLVQPYMSN